VGGRGRGVVGVSLVDSAFKHPALRKGVRDLVVQRWFCSQASCVEFLDQEGGENPDVHFYSQ